MSIELRELKNCEVSSEAAKQELDRLLQDSRFRVTERQKDILRYLANSRFDGCEGGVKAYSIALDVLGRTSDFDASTDPIVRIEISRLRSSLDSYYEAFGNISSVSICIPKGMYIAVFQKTQASEAPSEGERNANDLVSLDKAFLPPKDAEATDGNSTWAWIGGSLALTIALAASAVANVLWSEDNPDLIKKPIIHLSIDAADREMMNEANQLRDALTTALTRFGTLTVASTSSGKSLATKEIGRRYELQMKYYRAGEAPKIWWQIVESDRELVLKSGVEAVDDNSMNVNAMREQVAGRLASRLASARGIINTIEITQNPKQALGNNCLLRAENALDQVGAEALAVSGKCLEQTIAKSGDEADATALLSRVMLAGKDAAQDPAIRMKALSLAKRAVSLAPNSDRTQLALMAAQFADGNVGAAILAGNRAVELNPYNTDNIAKLAFILYLGDDRDAGVALAREVVESNAEEPPSEAMLVLALNAYRSAQYSEASLFAERITGTDFLVAVLRTAALAQLNVPSAQSRLSQLPDTQSNFAAGFRNGISWWRQEQGLLQDLQADLAKASGRAGGDVTADMRGSHGGR